MIEQIYAYRDASGTICYEVVRRTNKSFYQRKPDGKGGYINDIKGVEKLPYRFPELITGVANGETILIVEGEKDADRLASLGWCATTISGGAKQNRGKMRDNLPPHFAELFKTASRVVICGDNDKAGAIYAETIAQEISAVCPDVRLLSPMPGATTPGYDVSNWLNDGHTIDDLTALIQATPRFAAEFEASAGPHGTKTGDAENDRTSNHHRSASPAARLINLILEENADLFHDAAGECFATYSRNGHRETAEIMSTRFKRYCRSIYYKATAKAIPSNALNEALNSLDAMALFEGPESPTYLRCAREGAFVYVDLVDEEWNVVAVSADGYSVIPSSECHVRFVRRPGMLSLPTPSAGGTLKLLDAYLPSDHRARVLVKALMVAYLYADIPCPILNLTGPQGSGKSTVGRRLRSVIDPNKSPLRSEPREIRDIGAAAQNNHVCAFDNVSKLPEWLSDTLCRLATGGGFAGRRLYTDDEEHVVDAIRPVIITAIENVVLRGDLADRTITVNLHMIDEQTRQTEAAMDARFDSDRPLIFGALLEALALGLKFQNKVDQSNLGRMADFEQLGRASAAAFGVTEDIFAEICRQARLTTSSDVTDASPLTDALRNLASPEWIGTFAELFKLVGPPEDRGRRAGGWPLSPRGLSAALKRLIPDLRQIGIHIEIGEPDRRRSRVITVRSIMEDVAETTSATSATSASNVDSTAAGAPSYADDSGEAAGGGSNSDDTSADERANRAPDAGVADVADVFQGAVIW